MSARISKQKLPVSTRYGAFDVTLQRDSSGYLVLVTKLPEVVTYGRTISEAKRMAVEAIEVAIEGEVLTRAARSGTIRFSNRRKTLA
jgi:predicted RNase H-like HicB family nuclease